MIDSVVELVNKTASNSLFMFLFCNFIIILILMGNSKPGSNDNSNPGLQKSVMISDSVLSSKPGFENFVLISESILSSKSGFEKSGLMISEPTRLSSKPGLQKPVLISESVLSTKPGFEKSVLISESTLSSKPGLEKSMLLSDSVISSKPGFEKSKMNLSSNPGLQEPGLTSKSAISSKPSGFEQSLTSRTGSDFSEKDEKGSLEENENEVECLLRRRVEEFIRKVNTQWKSENTKSNYLLH